MFKYKLENKIINRILLMITPLILSFYSGNAQVTVSSLSELRSAVQNSNQTIIMASGKYNIETLSSNLRSIECTGSNNTIHLTGVYIEFPVGSSDLPHFFVEGDNVTILGGEFENTYYNGMTEITDFEAYNNDRSRLAKGGDPHIRIAQGTDGTIINGTKMTVRGSFPYGYGSLFGIGSSNTFGLDKRGGIEVRGPNTTIENCEIQMQAFGHAIYIQDPADNTIINNTLVEGKVRPVADIIEESADSLPARNDYKDNEGNDMDPTDVISLCEDGFRVYNGGGSVALDNCTAMKTRGGIRLYLASNATVTNSTAIDCGATNWNMPSGGEVVNSSGNFAYAPLSDFRLSRNNTDIEWTIIPSPHAKGPHNLADVLGSNHNIVFHRTPGPLDLDEERAIVVSGDNSTIVNETEYRIILESGASGNTIISCGPVTDNGSNNTITITDECGPIECDAHDAFSVIQAEDFCDQSNVRVTDSNALGYIQNGSWVKYEGVNFGDGVASITALVSSGNAGGKIEIRQESENGNLLGILEVPNTGSWTEWETHSVNIESVSGAQDICLVFTGDSGYLLDVDWFQFSNQTLSNDELILNDALEINIYPNPAHSSTTLVNAKSTSVNIYDINGSLKLSQHISRDEQVLDLSLLSSGVYYAEINKEMKKMVVKLVKK